MSDESIQPTVLEAEAQVPAVRSRQDGLLTRYLAEVRSYPLLDAEEEKELAILHQEEGDAEAARKLVTSNLRLVVKLAFQYHRQWNNVLDLIQEGNVGLVEALSRYDPYRGIRFSSYAQYWIRAMILRFLTDNFRIVRLGSTRHGRKLFFQLQKEKERLIQAGEKISSKLLAENLDVPESEIIAVEQQMRAPSLSLDASVGDSEGRPLSEILSDKNSIAPDEIVAQADLGLRVRQLLDAFAETLMDEREVEIWHRRLMVQDPTPLSQLGREFGISKERVRQLEKRIRDRLRAFMEGELGQEIDFEFSPPEPS